VSRPAPVEAGAGRSLKVLELKESSQGLEALPHSGWSGRPHLAVVDRWEENGLPGVANPGKNAAPSR
jgi:hypothetical protein